MLGRPVVCVDGVMPAVGFRPLVRDQSGIICGRVRPRFPLREFLRAAPTNSHRSQRSRSHLSSSFCAFPRRNTSRSDVVFVSGNTGKVVETYQEHDVLMGKVDFGGVAKRVCLDHVPDVQVGKYVLVHVGFALSVVDEEEANRCSPFCGR